MNFTKYNGQHTLSNEYVKHWLYNLYGLCDFPKITLWGLELLLSSFYR